MAVGPLQPSPLGPCVTQGQHHVLSPKVPPPSLRIPCDLRASSERLWHKTSLAIKRLAIWWLMMEKSPCLGLPFSVLKTLGSLFYF